jgi:hypothetical protein
MTGEILSQISLYSTIGANLTTILTWIITILFWVPVLFYFFGWKKYKSIIVSSKTFSIPLEKEDISKAVYPGKIYDESIDLSYDKSILSPKDFCNNNIQVLKDMKGKYNPICVFWIAEVFIFFWIWYYFQDSLHLKWFRKLKDNLTKFSWNPWSWTSFFSLKWILSIKWLFKSITNRYNNPIIDCNEWEEINLIINISHEITEQNIPSNGKKNIKFGISRPDTSFLINEAQVFTFSEKIKKIMQNIDKQLWQSWKVNIFCTLPVPFMIKLWQSIHRNWPECILYDFDRWSGEYIKNISTKDFIL